jgi:hypothetical protein
MCLFAIRDVLKVTQSVKAVRLRCSPLCSKTFGSTFTRFWCPTAETLSFSLLTCHESGEGGTGDSTLPWPRPWMSVGGQRYAPLILYEWYFTRKKAHVLLQNHVCLTDFLEVRRKPHVLYVLGYMPWWFTFPNTASIEQMLKQFPSCFNASADIRDGNFHCMCRILHAGTHCALSCGDAMTQAFAHIARLMISGRALERHQRYWAHNPLHRAAKLVQQNLACFAIQCIQHGKCLVDLLHT